jgi:hypothetical protein
VGGTRVAENLDSENKKSAMMAFLSLLEMVAP